MSEHKDIAGGDGQNQNVDAGSGNQKAGNMDSLKAEILTAVSGQITGAVKRILAQEKKTTPENGEVDLSRAIQVDGENVTLAELVKNRQELQAERLAKAEQERYGKIVEGLTNRGVFEPKVIAKALMSESESVDLDAFCRQHPGLVLDRTRQGGGGGSGMGFQQKQETKRTSEADLDKLAAGVFLR